MSESIIQIDTDNPVEFFGPGDKYLNHIKAIFPKLKIVVRGNLIKLIGEPAEIGVFEKRLELLLVYFDRFGKITEKAVEQIMEQDDDSLTREHTRREDVLVYGRHGKLVKAQTANQKKMVESMDKNDMLFAIGPAGTGKTYTAVALAVRALKNKEVKRIILTRPAVEAGESLGFLPGDMKDKLDPYLQPLYDALRDMLPTQKLLSYLEDETIEIAPLAYMRGRTLGNVFAILDEAQNASESQLKMFLTRMGKNSKFIITGDVTQIDLPRHKNSGLLQAQQILKGIKGIDFIYLNEKDIVRNKLVTKIVNAYQKIENPKK
ncbi:PhoH family protein [Candidatus Sulfidibacterium hydrothermale]|uniref:PhoH family protein n=1 Tax=Candidatus Sulfidibacterium hydrothermale TaxID=2875962 RepID=UPI001F0A693A|nr:PhoH family protein [Candidatus Sulfidibacterium hydrothermale]UBM62568.1 PhoH family protein [Candidatus Sulfidibacterium hydrothermale]